MRKKLVIVSLILSVLIISSIIIVVNSKLSLSKSSYIDKNCWALYNYGQTVNGSVGVSGVDINIQKAWKLCDNSDNEVIVGVVDSGERVIIMSS